jgi:hypothetical protein
MLSDGEQRRLVEIESSLRLDDPSFARRFDAGLRTYRRRRLLPLVTMFVLAVIIAALAVVGLVAALIGS